MKKPVVIALVVVVGLLVFCLVCCGVLYATGALTMSTYTTDENGKKVETRENDRDSDLGREAEDEGGRDSADSRDAGTDTGSDSGTGDTGDAGGPGSEVVVPSGYTTYSGDGYSVSYPKDWSITDQAGSKLIQPAGSEGTANIVLNYTSANIYRDITESSCSSFKDSFIKTYKSIFDEVNDPMSYTGVAAGNSACIVNPVQVTNPMGVNLEQKVYYIVNDDDTGKSISVIFTYMQGETTKYSGEFTNVLETIVFE